LTVLEGAWPAAKLDSSLVSVRRPAPARRRTAMMPPAQTAVGPDSANGDDFLSG
jgi:hypothetical protein